MFEPPPLLPSLDIGNMLLTDAKSGGDFGLRLLASKRPDHSDVIFGDFGKDAALAPTVCVMQNPVFVVGASGFPRKVFAIYAGAIAASVRRFIVRGRRWAVGCFADKLVDVVPMAEPYRPISASNLVEGPNQTIVAVEFQDHVVVKILDVTVSRFCPRKRVAVSSPSRVMHLAPAATVSRLAAILNRAYGFVSHFDLLQRLAWLEPVAALERSAGSLFLARCSVRGKI